MRIERLGWLAGIFAFVGTATLSFAATGNRAPVMSGAPGVTVAVGNTYSFIPVASDPDGDGVSFSIWNKPRWALFDPATGRLTGTPGSADVGTSSNIFITATDGLVNTVLGPINIAVRPATQNGPPTISGAPPTSVLQGAQYAFQPTARDPDGDPVSFSIWNQPRWASFDPATGRLAGTPGSGDVGTSNSIFITATDGLLNSVLGPFTITVRSATQNGSPTISGAPPTSVSQGTQYAFQPTASDPNGDRVSFSIWNQPRWASFDPATGRLAGTPGSGDVGTSNSIFITATDGLLNSVLGPFNIAVRPAGQNGPPTLSGTPPTSVLPGTQYAFQPMASDPDGDAISFSVWNKPSWATFDSSTGRLAGTPGPGDIGTTSSVFIIATDGRLNTNLGPFNIAVQGVANGSATLSWQPPTQNTDGSALTDLAGFKVYWGTSPGVYANSVTLNNSGLTSYVLGNLVPGTYFFVVTAFNRAGVESPSASPASKTIS